MFKEMRRQDRSLSVEETTAILTEGIYGVLSLSGNASGEYAYGVPLSYVYKDDCLYLHCAVEGQKLNRLRQNNRVSFCVVGKAVPMPEKFGMSYASAIVFGTVQEVSGEEKMIIMRTFLEKYSAEHLEKGEEYLAANHHKIVALKIDIEYISGKARKV